MLKRKFPKFIYLLLCFLLIFQQSGFAQIAGSTTLTTSAELNIAGHLSALHNSLVMDKFRPLHLRYLSYDSIDNNFKLLLDKGDSKNPRTQELENTSKELLKYFFIGISLPNDSFWVNLRPDAEDNIIDDYLARTDIGKIMLESDLQLKKDTAKATSPETPEGRKYWNKLYQKAGELFGSENITIPTLTRPWILPDEIIIRETVGAESESRDLNRPYEHQPPSAYIYKATLKVMLEQDYLKGSVAYNFKDERLKQLNEYSSQLIRELIIPKLTKEVNTSKRYASLRQVYYSLILAQWFKARFRPSLLRASPAGASEAISGLINSQNLANLTSKTPWSKTTYFKEYQKSFKDGEYNIKKPVYTLYGQSIRSYFSGGELLQIPRMPSFGSEITTETGGRVVSLPASRDFDAEDKPNLAGMEIKARSFGEFATAVSSSAVENAPKLDSKPALESSLSLVKDRKSAGGWLKRGLAAAGLGWMLIAGLPADTAKPVRISSAWIDKLRESASTNPSKFFDSLSQDIANQPKIKELIETLGNQNSLIILANADKLKGYPWAEKIVKETVEEYLRTNSLRVLENADKLKDYPWAEGLVKQAAESIYEGEILKNADKLKYYPSSDEIVEQAAEKMLIEEPFVIVGLADKLQGYPFAEMVVRKAVEKQFPGSYAIILQYASEFKSYPSVEGLVKQAAERADKEYPAGIMVNIGELKSYSWAETLIKRAVQKVAGVVILSSADELKNYPWAESFVKSAFEGLAATYSRHILWNADKLKGYSWVEETVNKVVHKITEEDPLEIVKNADELKYYPSVKELVKQAIKKVNAQDPEIILKHLHKLIDFMSAEEIEVIWEIIKAEKPEKILECIQEFRDVISDEKVEQIFVDDPSELMRNEKAWPILRSLFWKTHSPKLKPLLEIIDSSYDQGDKQKWAALLDIMVRENRSIDDMVKMGGVIIYNSLKFRLALLDIKLRPNHLGDRSVDKFLKEIMLRRVWVINDLHNESDIVRFKSVDGASIEELYLLMVYGEDEIFTSTFNGLFNRLLQVMEKSNLSGSQLLNNVGYNKFRIFIKLVANYQRLKEFLGTMDEVAQQELLQRFVKNIDQEKDKLAQAVAVADSFGELQDAGILRTLQTAIKSEYERVKSLKDSESQTIYGLLAGMFGKKAVINEAWLQEMSRQYRLPDLTKVTQAQLFKGGVNVQRYFFYKDEDGQASFESFLSQYRRQANWKVEIDKAGGYVHISSDNQKVEIYANLPSNENNGQDAIEKVLKQKGLMVSIYVHRGHSYHADNTIERIGSEAAIVFLGSCGGYSNVHEVLSQSPEAHIISTKGIGTMTVNDPLLKMLSERLRQGQDIQWVGFWPEAKERLGQNGDFGNYIAPHKNLGALFIKAYHRIIEKQNTAYQDSREELNRYASDFVNNPPAVASSSAVKDEKDLGFCLTPDSLISTVSNAGLEGRVIAKPLIELKPGEMVLSLNEATGKLEPHRVNALLDMGVKPVYRIRTKSGKELKTTLNHPYLTKDGWRKLKDIKTGDEIACLPARQAVGSDLFRPDSNAPIFYNKELSLKIGFIESLKKIVGIFNDFIFGHIFNIDNHNTARARDRKAQDIAKVFIEGQENAVVFNRKVKNSAIRGPSGNNLSGPDNVQFTVFQRFDNVAINALVSNNLHNRALGLKDYLGGMFHKLRGIFNSGNDILFGNAGILLRNFFYSIASANEIENIAYRNPCSLNAGLAKSDIRSNYNFSLHNFYTFIKKNITSSNLRQDMIFLSLNEATGKLEPHRVNALLDMGVKPVYRLTTASGKELKTTLNHPYLTKDGWRKLKDIEIGEVIVAGRSDPADAVAVFSGNDQAAQEVFFRDAQDKVIYQGKNFSDIQQMNPQANNPATRIDRITQDIGKIRVPGDENERFLFDQFVDFFISCGGVNISNVLNLMAFSFKKLAYTPGAIGVNQKLHGVLSGLADKFFFVCQKGGIQNTGLDIFVGDGRKFLFDSLYIHPASHSLEDNMHRSARSFDTRLAMLDAWFNANMFIKQFFIKHFISLQKQIYHIAEFLSRQFTGSDILWDKIVSIEPLGPQQVYDIEVQGTHNFVANGIVAHNTYQNAGDRKQGTEKEPTASSVAERGKPRALPFLGYKPITQEEKKAVMAEYAGITEEEFNKKALFHGTFKELDQSMIGVDMQHIVGTGVYFADKETAQNYAELRVKVRGGIPRLIAAQVIRKNFLDISKDDKLPKDVADGWKERLMEFTRDKKWFVISAAQEAIDKINLGNYRIKDVTWNFPDQFSEYMKSLGFDGLILTELGEGSFAGATYKSTVVYDLNNIITFETVKQFKLLAEQGKVSTPLFSGEKEQTSSPISNKGGIDGLASSPSILQEIKAPGGIDFRALPIVTRAMSNLSLNVSRIPLSSIEGINLDQELREIQRLVKAGITPSADRIREYVQVSCLKGNSDMRKVVSCIADILRLEEERSYLTDTTLKDILVVLESGRPAQELKEVFTGANS